MNKLKAFTPSTKLRAFTIVELLVVIVVIGVLAAISIVSYGGISKRAALTSLQSDLSNASNKLKAYQTIYGSYPTLDGNNCPSAPTVDSNYCLKFSPNNSIATTPFAGYVPNNTTTPQTFSLTLSGNGIQGVITESSKPNILTPTPLNPVADWIATPQGDHYGNYYDPVSKSWANVTRSTPKTIYDPATQHIYDVPANYLAINPWSVYQPGGNGSAAVIEEARTNYLLNSSFDTDSNSDGIADNWWNFGGFNPVIFSVANESVYGNKSQRMVIQPASNTGSSGVLGQTVSSVVPGEVWTFSSYLKGTTTNCFARLHIQAMQDTTWLTGASTPSITLTDQWTYHSVSFTLPANTNKIYLSVWATGYDAGDQWDVTISAAQAEKGAFSTSYIPTTNTVVGRNGDGVTVPTTGWNGINGTWATLSGSVPSNSDGGVPHSHWTWWKDGGNFLYSYVANGATYVAASASSSTTVGDIISTSKTTHVTVSRYKAGQPVRLFVDGVAGTGTNIHNSTTGLPSTATIGNIYNAPISRIAVYSYALSDTEAIYVTSSIKDGL